MILKIASKYFMISLLVSMAPTLLYGQEAIGRKKQLSIGMGLEPLIAYRQILYRNGNEQLAGSRNNNEIPKLGFRYSLFIRKNISDRFSMEYGLAYSNVGYRTKLDDLVFIVPSEGFPDRSRTAFSYRSVGVPIKGNYGVQLGRVRGYVAFGAMADLILGKVVSLSVYYPNGETMGNRNVATLGYRAFNLTVLAGLGANYVLFKRLTIGIEPLFQRHLTSVSLDKNASEFPYTFGLNMKALYSLSRR